MARARSWVWPAMVVSGVSRSCRRWSTRWRARALGSHSVSCRAGSTLARDGNWSVSIANVTPSCICPTPTAAARYRLWTRSIVVAGDDRPRLALVVTAHHRPAPLPYSGCSRGTSPVWRSFPSPLCGRGKPAGSGGGCGARAAAAGVLGPGTQRERTEGQRVKMRRNHGRTAGDGPSTVPGCAGWHVRAGLRIRMESDGMGAPRENCEANDARRARSSTDRALAFGARG